MHRSLLLLSLLFLSLPGSALAQSDESPLAGLEGPIEGLSRSDLDTALSARQSCQSLIRLINDLGNKWQDMREDRLKSTAYIGRYQDARVEWDIRWGACAGARRDLREGMPRSVLDYEVHLLKRLWLGLNSVSEALMDERPAVQINKTAAVYERAMAQWSAELPRIAGFWSGDHLLEKEENDGCIALTEQAQQKLAMQLMTAASVGANTADTLDTLRPALGEADKLRRECKHTSPMEEIELQLLARSMRSYRRFFDALLEEDDAAIREAMISAQSAISRLERCRQEHRSSGEVSSTCTPQ